jgi:hypothetical protein
MTSDVAWRILGKHIPWLVSLMVTVPKGTAVEVFCNPEGTILAAHHPTEGATIRLCVVTSPALEHCYAIRPQGPDFVDDDGQVIPASQLAARLTRDITDMKNGGAEWGWELKPAE